MIDKRRKIRIMRNVLADNERAALFKERGQQVRTFDPNNCIVSHERTSSLMAFARLSRQDSRTRPTIRELVCFKGSDAMTITDLAADVRRLTSEFETLRRQVWGDD